MVGGGECDHEGQGGAIGAARVAGGLALLGVVLAVLGGFVAFFIYIARRASSMTSRETESPETTKQLSHL